jgi:hypothetical protein
VSDRTRHALSAEASLRAAVAHLAGRADAIFAREPLVDPYCPDTGDVDLLVFGPVRDLLPERLFLPEGPVDLIWLPTTTLDDPARFAARGVVPHRLLSSRLVHDRTGGADRQARLVEDAMFEPAVQAKRIAGLLELGFLTVREMGITWDYPALALFWLHVSYAACLAALADATRTLCPNVYSRPFDYTGRLEERTGLALTAPYLDVLRLRQDPAELAPALWRIHAAVSRFPEPAWPPGAKDATKYEYRYFGAASELEWRIRAAAEMSRRGRPANGVFYLRLMGYALARIPSVHADSVRGETPAFLRPPRRIRRELEGLCPEVVSDLAFVLGGPEPLDVSDVKHSLGALSTLRRQALALIESRDIVLPSLPEWVPFSAKAPSNDSSAKEPPRTTEADPSNEELSLVQDRRNL